MTDQTATNVIVRRMVFPLLVGLLLGWGIGALPKPLDLIAALGLAAVAIGVCVWGYVGLRRQMHRLEEMRSAAEAYIASHDRHPRA